MASEGFTPVACSSGAWNGSGRAARGWSVRLRRERLWLHILLFLLTAFTTTFVGARLFENFYYNRPAFNLLQDFPAYVDLFAHPTRWLWGLPFSVTLLTILLAHEMGHYCMSRRYGIPTTLPYFIPLPLPPFGTFGAIIKMKGIIINKKALFDIGVAGPLASFVLSVPCALIGIKLSTVVAIDANSDYIRLGDPLLFKLIQWILIGELPPGHDIILHPLAYAGWVGLFVTALNLLPVGQLDGGHVIYAVFGDKSKWAFGASLTALILLAIFYNPGWLALIVLLLIFGMRHPQPFDAETPLDTGRKILACLMLLVFILSFMPSPFLGLSLFGSKGGVPA